MRSLNELLFYRRHLKGNSVQLADLPFGYMYTVRLRTPVRAISLMLAEWLPLALALKLAYSARFCLSIVMLAGNFVLYECGYFINDLADSASDPNGDHLEGRRIHVTVFFATHLLVFLLVTIGLFVLRGPRFAVTYSTLAILVLLIFLWHTTRWPRKFRFLRIFTFAALSLYKFCPVLIPFLSFGDAFTVLIALFFGWGLWRVITYSLIKFGDKQLTSKGQDFDPFRLFHLLSLAVGAPLFIVFHSNGPSGKAALVIWLTYMGLALLRTGYQLTDWKLTQAHYLRRSRESGGSVVNATQLSGAE
jgi:hypothetical protein